MKTSNQTKKVVMASLAAVYVAFAAGAAQADETSANVATRTVHYADLNLNTQAGISALYNRIRGAAKLVCGDVDAKQLEEALQAKACVAHAVQVSVSSVNNARLTNEHLAHVGGVGKTINVATR